jgi:hypothetical protein
VTSSYLTEKGALRVLRLCLVWNSSFSYIGCVSGKAGLMAVASSLILELDGIIDVSK